MAQDKLRLHHSKRQVISAALASLVALLPLALTGCVHAQDNKSVGMTLLFLNKGQHFLLVKRFDPDGQRGPVPGALGAGAGIKDSEHGKQMSFMPGDSKRGVPQFVEVEWKEETPQVEAKLRQIPEPGGEVSRDERARLNKLLDEAYALRKHYTRRIDLTPILTPELLAQVRANRSSTNLKLTIVFQGENVTITAAPEVWRK